jgi:hypothetical protein
MGSPLEPAFGASGPTGRTVGRPTSATSSATTSWIASRPTPRPTSRWMNASGTRASGGSVRPPRIRWPPTTTIPPGTSTACGPRIPASRPAATAPATGSPGSMPQLHHGRRRQRHPARLPGPGQRAVPLDGGEPVAGAQGGGRRQLDLSATMPRAGWSGGIWVGRCKPTSCGPGIICSPRRRGDHPRLRHHQRDGRDRHQPVAAQQPGPVAGVRLRLRPRPGPLGGRRRRRPGQPLRV